MANKNKKLKVFKIQPYGANVQVTKDPPKDKVDGQYDGLTWLDLEDPFQIFVWINIELDLQERSLIVVHEAVHVAQFIEKAVDTKFDDETEAYLIVNIVQNISEQLCS